MHRQRSHRLLLAVTGIVLFVAVPVVVRGCTSSDSAHRTPNQSRTGDANTAAVRGPVGPTRTERNVPQGWRHDPTGARAAAIADVALTGDIAHAGVLARHDMITQLATDAYAPTLAALTDRQIGDLLDPLGRDNTDPTQLVWLETPLTARVAHHEVNRVQIDVWSLLVLGAPDAPTPRQAWRTVTVTLVWEHDDWKVAAWTARAGPTPALAPEVDIADLAHLAGPARWPTALPKETS